MHDTWKNGTNSDHRLAGIKEYSSFSFKNFIYFNLFFTDFTLTLKYFVSDAPEVILQYQKYLSFLLK